MKSIFSILLLTFSIQIAAYGDKSKPSIDSSNNINKISGKDSNAVMFTVIAHRGASGYLPEHTLDAATLAFMQGADFIEQDIILTADNVPIVLHDIHIETVTNVESVFPERKRLDGRYYAIDFTWDEIQQLYVHERENLDGSLVYPSRYKGHEAFKVASFEQHIELIKRLNKVYSKNIGFYPEIKSPEWHLSEGKDITKIVFEFIQKNNLNRTDTNIMIQSFYPPTLKRLKNEFSIKVPLVQLIAENDWEESSADYEAMMTLNGLEDVASYASGIGPWLPQIYDTEKRTATELLKHAKSLQLVVHPYTFRADDLAYEMNAAELIHLLKNELQVDGVFTDHTDIVLEYIGSQTNFK